MPTISVVMPVHNALPYLAEALKSLLRQDCDDFEIIALDDASTDGSAAYLDSIDDPRLRVLHCPKQGLTKLLNVGLREARGPLVARMDADDISLPHRLRVQRSFLEAHPDVVTLGCQAEVVDEGGRLQYTWAFPVENVPAKLALFRNEASFVHPGVMFRRDAVLAVGGYNESLPCTQDRDLWWKLADQGKFHNHPEPLIHYRRHVNSISTARYAEQVRLAVEVTRRYGALYGIDGEQLECFQRVDDLARWYRAEGLSIKDVLSYVTVLNRILRLAVDRWDAEDVEINQIRRERWEFLVWRLRTSRPPAQEWLRCLRTLLHLSPGEMRPDRLANRLVRRMIRRLLLPSRL
jgi:glycosyltransferase involved in cell wall biosynthesis